MQHDYQCSSTKRELAKLRGFHFGHHMRLTTFCPCPGGDSPGAKRMFDAILAGCIPIILSWDFVWPFTTEADPTFGFNSSEFSLRFASNDFVERVFDDQCQLFNSTNHGFQGALEKISSNEIARLRTGLAHAQDLYAWYEKDPDLPDNPLSQNILPTGGAAHALVHALAERAAGARWPACQEELLLERGPAPNQFVC